jgi:Omp85 superfamily domain
MAQKVPKDSTKLKLVALPVVFYTPETRLGFGAGGLLAFNTPGNTLRNSVTVSFAYTQNKQILMWMPFQYYARNRSWQTTGEVGYFDFVFNFFGVGNQVPNQFIEKYDARFPRLRATTLKRFRTSHFVGWHIAFDDFMVRRIQSDGLLITPEFERTRAGGRVAGVGIAYQHDTRNSNFYPTKGHFVQTLLYRDAKLLGSSFAFTRITLDAAAYLPIHAKTVLAVQFASTISTGDVPFYQMAKLGGTKLLRGYFEGKYLDRNSAIVQTEYRRHLWKRLGAVVFGGAGTVWGKENESAKLRYSFGPGLRIALDQKNKLNARIDYGIGRGSTGFYFTFGEAF